MKVHIISDRLSPFKASLSLRLRNFRGETSWSEERELQVPANTSALQFEIPVKQLLGTNGANQVLLEAKLLEGGKEISFNNFYFTPIKEIDLPKPEIALTDSKTEDGFLLELSSDVLAKNVYLSMEEEGFFSDNYFDLRPGETKIIHLKTEATGDIIKQIGKMTIRDTYQE